MLDSGLRPEECYRLRWEQIQDDAISISTGKGKGSKRRFPCTARIRAMLDIRRTGTNSEWVFPAPTKSGHIEASSLRKRHEDAIAASGISRFVVYGLRHTRVTRWAKILPLPVVQRLAGHISISTTMLRSHQRRGRKGSHAQGARGPEWTYF